MSAESGTTSFGARTDGRRICAYEACPHPDQLLPTNARADMLRHPDCRRLASKARADGVPHHRAGEDFWRALAVRGGRVRRPVSSSLRGRARPAPA